MAGGAAAESIMFIGAMLAAAALVGAFMGVASELNTGMESRADFLADELNGRITIVNDPLHMTTSPLTLYVKNSGTVTQYMGEFAILVDGEASNSWTAEVGGASADNLKPGETATIEITDINPGAGDHRVVITSDTGHQAWLEFTV